MIIWSIVSYFHNGEWVTECFDNEDHAEFTEKEFNDLKWYVETTISPVKTWRIGKSKPHTNLYIWFTLTDKPQFNLNST